ncbi:MAG: cold-shock protein [Rhodothermaceae bacterium]|nr:MAG: cold-shock protein [Rhodothermaceae bacterium]
MKVQRSVVKWFDAKKGYGFILNPDQGPDIFVHYTQIISEKRFKTLRTGEVVEYELQDGPKGLHAHAVRGTDDIIRPSLDPAAVAAVLNNGGTLDASLLQATPPVPGSVTASLSQPS